MPRSIPDAAGIDSALSLAERADHAREIEERDAVRRQLIAAEEAERRRLARELHDQLGQHLTALSLGLDDIAGLLPPDSPAVPRLAGLIRLTGLLTRDVRYLALELRPPELDDIGLDSALATYVEQWTKRYGIPAELAITGATDAAAPAEMDTAIYRIVQEALVNVAKHAGAKQVSVILARSSAEVRLIVEDDGRGFDVPPTRARARRESRFGLGGMEERAVLARGRLEVESAVGKGTTIHVRFPRPQPT